MRCLSVQYFITMYFEIDENDMHANCYRSIYARSLADGVELFV